MRRGWMVRAGQGGRFFNEFEQGFVAVGWSALGDLTTLATKEQLTEKYNSAYNAQKPAKRALAIGTLLKFRDAMQSGDVVVTYDPSSREYLVGEISGDYSYSPETLEEYPQKRPTKWLGRVHRDKLKQATRNSLGSVMTLFKLKDHVIEDLLGVLEGKPSPPALPDDASDEDQEEDVSKEDIINKSKELIKDLINALDHEDMEQLVASIFRAMGFRSRVSPKGPDRGVDVFASPDGLGLEEPRIKAEVKHRNGAMGAQHIRSFLGALRPGDRGVYVSTGGFSRESRYEAERANIPVSLVDIDDLASLVVDFYEEFDLEGKALIPLVRLYWPADL